MNNTRWLSQMHRGVLEHVMLSLIKLRPEYGFNLINAMKQYEVLAAESSYIEALLRKLEQSGLVVSYWQEPTPKAWPRRYYSLTAEGEAMLRVMDDEWRNIKAAVDSIILSGDSTEQN